MITRLKPDAYFKSVLDIDPVWLVSKGYRAVLLDLDNTLQPRDENAVPEEVKAWVQALKDHGLEVAIVTNTDNDRVLRASQDLDVLLVRNAMKPFTRGYVTACACLGVACKDAVMIGDQSYTDILGAHNTGMDAIMVEPQSLQDPIHTRALRLIDGFAVKGMSPRGNR